MQDYRVPKLEVFAVDSGMQRRTGSIPYTSLQWERRYWEPGRFTMELPASVYDPSWAYLVTDMRPETAIIERVVYADTAFSPSGDDTVTLSGRFMECVLNDRTFLVEETGKKTVTEMRYELSPRRLTLAESAPLYRSVGGSSYYKTVAGGSIQSQEGEVFDADVTAYVDKVDYVVNDNDYFARRSDGAVEMTTYTQTSSTTSVIAADDIVYDDGSSVFFRNSDGDIQRATGMTKKGSGSYYSYRPKRYEYSYEVRVKGPWQTTEVDDPEKAMDSVAHMLQWVQQKFGNTMLYEEPEFSGEVKVLQPSLKQLGDFLYEEGQVQGFSYRVDYDFPTDSFTFRFWRGKDRTQGQSANPWAVFSEEWGSLSGFAAATDVSAYKNTCYVLYDYDKPDRFNADGTPYQTEHRTWDYDEQAYVTDGWHVPYSSMQGIKKCRLDDGLPDKECVLDLRGDKPSCDGDWQRGVTSGKQAFDGTGQSDVYAVFEQGLEPQGYAYLANEHGVSTTLDTGTIDAHRYLEDFDLGDVVDMSIGTLGLAEEARIVGVVETHSADGSTVELEIGDPVVKTVRKGTA